MWLGSGRAASVSGVVWLVRPMPEGQWPPEPDEPRDDSFSWWVKSACGHPGGFKQWAFYAKDWATAYEQVFREDPCRYSRCQQYLTKIKNNGGDAR